MQLRTVAVLSLAPDSGHVRPLLRLARLLQVHLKCRIVCIVPSKFEFLVREYAFDLCGSVPVTSVMEANLAAGLSRHSIFYNAFSNYMDLSDCYWVPIRDAVSHELQSLVATLRNLKPEFLLCDDHVFANVYERFAESCGARLIVHGSEGTLRNRRNIVVRTYGLPDRGRWAALLLAAAGFISGVWFRLWRRTRYATRSRHVKGMKDASERCAAIAFGNSTRRRTDVIRVTSGLAMLEPDFGKAVACGPTSGEVFLAPTMEPTDGVLEPELEQWLARQAVGRVVYVCFGTMVALTDRMTEELIRGLADAGVSVLWSMPASQLRLIARNRMSDSFRLEEYVPQIALLASPRVGCFITHGGAGSVQDAVVCGKPVLCIPFMWDQPYNASLLRALGVGRVLSKRRVTWRRISREISELLNDPAYTESARRLAGDVRTLQTSEQQMEGIRRVLAGV